MLKKFIFFALLFVFVSSLRLYNLDSLPPSLYWEEAALGYDAYSILKTGRDHHGNSFPLVAFESFGDWKPSLYYYAIVPFIAILGLNEWAVRLPAAIASIFTIVATGLISKHIFDFGQKKQRTHVFFFSLFIAGISPWLLTFSRGGWEAMLATSLITWGVYLTLSRDKRSFFETKLFLACILFALSMYAYHAARLIAPLLGIIAFLLSLDFKNIQLDIKNRSTSIFISSLVTILILLPLLTALNNPSVNNRFNETSIFSDIEVIKESNTLIQTADNTIIARLLYHRYVLFGREILNNFFSHFSITYLFVSGDANPRHSIQYVGILYFFEAIALFLGVIYVLQKRNRYTFLIFVWLCLSIIPASLTTATPHALRTLIAFPAFLQLIVAGWYYGADLLDKNLFKRFKNGRLLLKLYWITLVATYLLHLGLFWRFYTKVYPVLYASEWQYGYRQLYNELANLRSLYPDKDMYISRQLGRPAMYYWFFNKEEPAAVQKLNQVTKKDQSEFLEYAHMKFISDWSDITTETGIIAIDAKSYTNFTQSAISYQQLSVIKNFRDEPVWYILEKTQ